jgi:hypothetical protein
MQVTIAQADNEAHVLELAVSRDSPAVLKTSGRLDGHRRMWNG